MKKLLLAAIAAFAVVSYAQEAKPGKKVLTEAEKEARRQLVMKKTGGIVMKKGEGKILFVNCQTKIGDKEITERVEKIKFVLKYNCELRKGEWKFGDGLPGDAKVAIYIVDDEKLPISLVATESHWGVVNVSKLDPGSRFSKALTRTFTLTAGAACSPVKTSPMQPVSSAADLDKLATDGFTFDMANALSANLKAIGVTPGLRSSYRKACMEGWAEPPANEYQKAVWDEVHTIPDQPITIKK